MPVAEEVRVAEIFQDSIAGSVIAAPVVGIDDETAARDRLRMNVRFRQRNLVADLICWSGTFSGFLLCIAQSKEQLLSTIARGFNILDNNCPVTADKPA